MQFQKDPQQELKQGADQAARETVQVMTASLHTLVETLRNADPEHTQNGEVKPIEITLNDEVVYQENGHGVHANSLSLGEVDFLTDALKHSPGEKVTEDDLSVNITIGGKQMLAIEKGVVTFNELQAEAHKQQDLDTLLNNQSTLNGHNGNGHYASNGFPTPPQTVTAVPIAIQEPIQVQRVRDQPPSILERLENTSLLTAQVRGEQWMKMPLKQRLSQAIADRFTTYRRQQVADAAIDLLQKNGTRQGKDFIYETEGYTLKAQGKHVTVHDREGRELLFIRTRLLAPPKVMGYYVTPQQEQEFLRVRERIKQFGLGTFSKDPLIRSKQLGDLTPLGDAKLTEDLKALSVVDVAQRFLDVSGSTADRNGKRVLEGSQYRIEQSPQGLSISTKDRGEILNLTNGKLTSRITPQDVRHFIFVAKELGRELKQIQTVRPATIQQTQR